MERKLSDIFGKKKKKKWLDKEKEKEQVRRL
jgi:hypothetical protein